jgi:hypothetical protein
MADVREWPQRIVEACVHGVEETARASEEGGPDA